MSDQAASALSNISPGDQLWYWLAFLGIICLLGIAVGSLIDIRRWWRDGRRQLDRVQRLAALDQAMQAPVTRDSQQAGLDHLAAIAADQQHGRAEADTEAISMRDLTVNAEFERMVNQMHWESVRDTLDERDEGDW